MTNRMAEAILGTLALCAALAGFVVLVYAVASNDAGAATEIGLLK
jgi:hypothetical protein